MTTEPALFLRNIWYYALPSATLKAGTMVPRLLLGEPLLFGRADDGKAFALRDICPHRGIPLSCGRFDGREVECCYHGWRFNPAGQCTAIPSLASGQDFDIARIKVQGYPLHEAQGAVWIWMGAGIPAMPPPELPAIGNLAPGLVEVMRFPCHIDHAVVGLMDPAHGPFVHRSWWWRSRASIHDKAKPFGPSDYGFTMRRHAPSTNSRAYRILGGAPQTEISFRLPGIRIEHVQTGKHHLINLTAVTPISETETEITHCIYWTIPWLSLLKPLIRPFAKAFLNQDRHIVTLQQQGLKHNPSLMLIKDADTQARWYYQLKAEFTRAEAERRAFENPVREQVLRWRS